MVLLKTVPNIKLNNVHGFGYTWLHEVIDNDGAEIVIWKLTCPHCKTILERLNEDNEDGVQRITLNIDDDISKEMINKTNEWGNMSHYHLDQKHKMKLIRHFGISRVPFVEFIKK